MDPELSEFLTAIPENSLVWIAFCADEESQIGGDFADYEEANAAAATHSGEMNHAATAILSFKPSLIELGAEQTLRFPFCFLYNSKPWQTIAVPAPSPDAAAETAAGIVAKLNLVAPSLGYPPLFTAIGGACPSA